MHRFSGNDDIDPIAFNQGRVMLEKLLKQIRNNRTSPVVCVDDLYDREAGYLAEALRFNTSIKELSLNGR